MIYGTDGSNYIWHELEPIEEPYDPLVEMGRGALRIWEHGDLRREAAAARESLYKAQVQRRQHHVIQAAEERLRRAQAALDAFEAKGNR